MLVKLHSTELHDYDLIMPTDWAIDLLIKQKLIKKIDNTKIDVLNKLYPTLLNHYFDPHNEYSIPFSWSLFGIGVNRDLFHNTRTPGN